jgi:hypothetical protein
MKHFKILKALGWEFKVGQPPIHSPYYHGFATVPGRQFSLDGSSLRWMDSLPLEDIPRILHSEDLGYSESQRADPPAQNYWGDPRDGSAKDFEDTCIRPYLTKRLELNL